MYILAHVGLLSYRPNLCICNPNTEQSIHLVILPWQHKMCTEYHSWNLFYLITVPWIFHRCGSYDHYLYALNYKDHCCTYKISCGGSIYGSPAIDMVLYWFTVSVFMEYMQMGTINLVSSIASLQAQNIIYVACTSGLVTAVSFEVI